MRRFLAVITMALVTACSRAPAPPVAAVTRNAESGDARMTVTVDRAKVEAGQPIQVTIEITGANAAPPVLPSTFGAFDVRPVPQKALTTPSPPAPRRAVFALTSLETGPLEIPAIEVPLGAAEPGKDDAPKLRTEPIPVEVTSLLAGDEDPKHFRDIKGLVDIDAPRDWRKTAVIVAVSLAAAGVAAWLLRMLLRRALRAAPELSAHERALRDLAALDAKALPASGRVHEYFVSLTDVVRSYIEHRYGIRAPELTTPEFLREARRSSSLADRHQTLLAGFLRGADLVKFGGVRPSAAHCAASMTEARHFVEESAPAPAAPAEASVPPSVPHEVGA